MGEGEDGMIWENKIETYILPYVNASWTYEAGHLKLVLGDNLEETGWGERKEGSSGWRGRMYIDGQFILMYDKNHDNVIK